MTIPKLRLVESRVVVRNAFTRLPFRFGVVTMEAAPVGILQVEVEFEGGARALGVASDFLAYKWFDKSPEKTPADNVADLLQAIRDARAVYSEAGFGTPYGLWLSTRAEIEAKSLARGFNRLGASFASSMMERAIIDAVGRHSGQTFDQMVRNNSLSIEPGALLEEVGYEDILGALPNRPLDHVALRHTVGLVDPISAADKEDDAPNDGFPVTLEEYLAIDKIGYLKVKVGGQIEEDIDRLTQIAEVVKAASQPIQMTFDGNEQYKNLEDFVALVERIKSTPELNSLWKSVLFIEQPLHRDVAMAAPLPSAAVSAIGKPLLIDEADGWAEAFYDAIELGYEGVSHKNCKGVYRSLINTGLATVRNRTTADKHYFLSAEDLTNLAAVPLQADLAVIATLGIPHVERNGHHYFCGLDHLPEAEWTAALSHHAGLYEPHGKSGALRIDKGMLDLRSLQVPGLGVADHPDLNDGVAEEDWKFEMLEKKK
ncbi:mandelate racemase [Sneathiella litorea]|uniref:Mandelate racemase n=1 Tax=Sneathiella litorea TaxID=2606216 RepID=A0A6L8WBA1_9PROT|nr:mandelate racemase [Sneathiella litorea]MZR32301.1 mandelate racemase [Sneathiella litorea]